MAKKTEERTALAVLQPPPPPASLQIAAGNPAKAFLSKVEGERAKPVGLPLVTINHDEGGFKLPSGELVPEISGYPIYVFSTRKFYEKAYSAKDKGAPPDCWSGNCVEPHATSLKPQSEKCYGCKHDQFGSARDGRGKACGEFIWTFLFNPGFGNPPVMCVVSPPSSIKILMGGRFQAGYFGKAEAAAGAYELVWTTFRLQPVEGAKHVVIEPIMGPFVVEEEKQLQLAEFRNRFKAAMDSLRMKTSEVSETGESQSAEKETEANA